MKIILDKKAFIEWKDKIGDIHKELYETYDIIVCNYVDIRYNFNDNYDGIFTSISRKEDCICDTCSDVYDFMFNYRYNTVDRFICNIYSVNCGVCGIDGDYVKIDLPKNYW